MKVDKHSTIGNIPIKAIRDFFIRYRTPVKFSLMTVEQYFRISNDAARVLCSELVRQEFIEDDVSGKYVVTVKGNALAQTKFVKRLNKEKADSLFRKFMDRVETVNSDNSLLYSVKQLFLFGSYLDCASDDFGDLDIAFVLERKIKDVNEFMAAQQKLIQDACDSGKSFSSIVEEVCYAETIVLKHLKSRSPYISLHRLSDVIELGVPYKQIYPFSDELQA
ncbi:MAG: hypothetical protein NC406_02230 [Bacteroides sp.]|nr:hypothetical protein [Bacteroides sp.]MCM1094855.1 hypothetical protein [Terasakiella sp.]